MNEIRLAHGGGGRFSQQLIEDVFLSVFGNEYLAAMNDSAILDINSPRIAFTTDSFVVEPVFFPGGDIGRLAVCGTVNDLAVMGANPLYLSIGFIIEEGFLLKDLRRIVSSIRKAADESQTMIVTGDTKVVPRGHADGLFINTSGIGILERERMITGDGACEGDCVLINAPVGAHGMAIMTSREYLGFRSVIRSDVRPLNHLIGAMLRTSENIHVMRDATRGGLATVCNEIARQSGVGIELDEETIPVTDSVRGACELLGFDPLYVANEGVLVAFLPGEDALPVLEVMRNHPHGRKAAMIGNVRGKKNRVVLRTRIGSRRILDMLSGEQLPRIC